MKAHKVLGGIALASALFVGTAGALAQQVVNVTQIPGYHAESGEFNVTPIIGSGYGADAIVNNGFESFCISRNVGIILPGSYFSFLSPDGLFLPDGLTITKGTAWLYSLFAAGTLPGYRYAGAGIIDPGHVLSQRAENAFDLQLAFWTLEGDYSYGFPDPDPLSNYSLTQDILRNPYLAQVAANFGGGPGGLLAALAPNSVGGYNVGVLNLNLLNPPVWDLLNTVQPILVMLSSPVRTNNVGPGDTATIGFWHNKNGQALINAMPNSPALGNWLAGNFPCLYGNLAGKANSVVAAEFMTYFNVKGQKTYAQVLGGALACYVTDSTLAGNAAVKYGFNVSVGGTGAKLYNVGSLGTVLGLSNNTSYTVLQLLQAANQNCPFNANVFNALNTIFDGINESGDIL